MKKSIKNITSLALSTLMAVSAIGGVTASAAEVASNPVDTSRTIYFINNKDWNDVYAYTWNETTANAQFPGQKLEAVGTTTVLGGEVNEVYSFTVDTAIYDAFIFSSPSTDRQQTKDVYFDWTGCNCFYLDDNNYAVAKKDFSEADIDETVTMYFVNSRDWENVSAYTWNAETTDQNGVTTTTVVESKGAFPGTQEVEKIGTTSVIDGKPHDVYAIKVRENDEGIVFSNNNGQQSSDVNIKYKWGGANMISLDQNNVGTVAHFFDSELENLGALN